MKLVCNAVIVFTCAIALCLAPGCGSSATSNSCPDGQENCLGICVTLASDQDHCGACDNACAADEVCREGICELSCGGGTIACNGACVDTDVDPANCGSCGEACDPGQVCDGAGQCTFSCQTGLTACDGLCVDLLTDDRYCSADGSCGIGCAAGDRCDGAGACVLDCQTGLTACDGECVNLLTDNRYCSADDSCGTGCAAGEVCDGSGICALSCQTGLTACDGECVNLLTDNRYCSADNSCGTGCVAGEVCDGSGICALSCQTGLTACNDECVNLLIDERFCSDTAGVCGSGCAAGEACNNGVCEFTCPNGLALCGAPGAEECVNLLTDNRFCSDTADLCGSGCAAGELCNGAGVCALSCQAGLTECADECVNLLTDKRFCSDTPGVCGTGCTQGETCNAGVCELACQTGLTICGAPGNEECVNLLTDNRYCSATPGVCGAGCGQGELCNGAGACALSCQTDLTACGLAGNEECVNLLTDNRYCSATPGVCGTGCGQGETCNAGVCELACQTGLTICGAPGNEECVNLLTDTRYCSATPGVCGAGCGQGETCNAGVCELACQAGLTICGAPDAEECVNLLTDNRYCSNIADVCGAGCLPGEICDGTGVCALICAPGLTECDDACVDTDYDPAHCGGCNAGCAPGEACLAGECGEFTTPACVFDTALLPVAVHPGNFCGDIAIDDQCNIIVGGCITTSVYQVSGADGSVSTLATMAGITRAVTFRKSDGLVYVADYDEVFVLSPGPTSLVNVGSFITSITVAPAGWGAFGNHIIVTKETGQVYAVDPAGPTATLVGTAPGGQASDGAFGPDGTLYLAMYSANKVVTMSPAGVVTDFVGGITGADGITVDPDGSRLFVTADAAQALYEVTIPGAVATNIGALALDMGWATSGILMDDAGNLLFKTSISGSAVIDFRTP